MLLATVLLLGCGRPGLEQLQSEITSAVGRTGPSTDPQQLTNHRATVRQAVTQSLQSATDANRPQLLQHCRSLVTEEFIQTYGYNTIAEQESGHFLGTLGGIQDAVWPVDNAWADQCLQHLLPNEDLQSQWLQNEAESLARVKSFLRGLQLSHAELLKTSGRAVSADSLQRLIEHLLDVAFRSKTADLRTSVVAGMLELFPAERAVIAKSLDQRLQKSDDPLSIELYEQFSTELQLSVPLAVLRQQLQATAGGTDAATLLQEIALYQVRAGQLAVSGDAVVSEVLQSATRRPLTAWSTSDSETDYLAALVAGLSTKSPQLAAQLQQQIDSSLSAQLQSSLMTGDETRIRSCLTRGERLGLNSERQRAIVEQLTAADTAEGSRQRLLYAAVIDQSSERIALIKSVLTRTSLTEPVLRSALALPRSPAEWSLITESLQKNLSADGITAEHLFLLSLDLPSTGPRLLLLTQAFRQQPPNVSQLQVLARVSLTDAETAELQSSLETFGRATPDQQPAAISMESGVNLLRAAPTAGFARLILSRMPPNAELTLAQLRPLLSPKPVEGIDDFLRSSASRALELAAQQPAEQAFTEALEFYEQYRESLRLTASPTLVQAAFENALVRRDPAVVIASLQELAVVPELLTEQNAARLREFAVAQLRRHAAEKQAVSTVTLDLLNGLKTHFPAERDTVGAAWQQLLLAEDPESPVLKQNIQAADKTGLIKMEQVANSMLQGLQSTFTAPQSADEFRRYRDQLSQLQQLFDEAEPTVPLLKAEQTRWNGLILDRVQALQQDYDGLTALLPVLEQASLDAQVSAMAERLLELSPLEDRVAVERDAERFLKHVGEKTDQVSSAAARRLLRYAIAVRNWPLAEQQLLLLKTAGALDAAEQAAEASLQNVFFGLQLARSWLDRRIPVNIVRTVRGRRAQINIDLQLNELKGEDIRGTTAIEHLVALGTFSGRIGENGLELNFTKDSLMLDSGETIAVTLGPGSVRSRYDDVEFSGMDRGARLLVGELADGDMLFLDLPRNVIPLKPRWEGLSEYGRRNWSVPPSVDENNRLYFQTAEFRPLGNLGHKLTFSISELTRQGPVTVRGDLLYFSGATNPKTASPNVRFLRNAELAPFAKETIRLRPNTGDNADLRRHFGRQRIELLIPQDTRLLIIEADMMALAYSAVWFNGMSLELPAAAVPAEPVVTK